MQTATKGDTVLIDYTVKTTDGRIVGKTDEGAPVSVTIGGSQIFPEVEAALDGMEVGAEQSVTVSTENAFGPRREDMLLDIPREQLPAETTPEPGMTLAAQQQDGSTVNLTITKVSDETVTADANHPLAGEDLDFALKLVEIQTAA